MFTVNKYSSTVWSCKNQSLILKTNKDLEKLLTFNLIFTCSKVRAPLIHIISTCIQYRLFYNASLYNILHKGNCISINS